MKWKNHRIWVDVYATTDGKYCGSACPLLVHEIWCHLREIPEKLKYAEGTFGEYFTTETCKRRIKEKMK